MATHKIGDVRADFRLGSTTSFDECRSALAADVSFPLESRQIADVWAGPIGARWRNAKPPYQVPTNPTPTVCEVVPTSAQ